MTGLTAPLAKTMVLPCSHQTRPITILPQLYRLWSMVAGGQISDVFSRKKNPKMSQAFSNIVARLTPHMVFSFTLSVQKLMDKPWLGSHWTSSNVSIMSNGSLARMWLIQGQVFTAGGSSTGFPEGDAWK